MKKFLLVFALVSASSASNAQDVMHGFGATISAMFGQITTPYLKSSFSMSQTNVTYFPRLNFVENENSTVSVGAPVSVGFGLANNTMGSDVGVAFAYELPLVLDYNIGAKSSSYNENTFGVYFGTGFSYYHVNISKSEYSNFKGSSYGPLVRAGVRFTSMAENWNGHGISVGVFYKQGLESDRFKTAGANVIFDL